MSRCNRSRPNLGLNPDRRLGAKRQKLTEEHTCAALDVSIQRRASNGDDRSLQQHSSYLVILAVESTGSLLHYLTPDPILLTEYD